MEEKDVQRLLDMLYGMIDEAFDVKQLFIEK